MHSVGLGLKQYLIDTYLDVLRLRIGLSGIRSGSKGVVDSWIGSPSLDMMVLNFGYETI